MQQKDALQFLAIKLELPREDTRGQNWNRGNRRRQQVVVGCIRQATYFRPLRDKVESHCCDEQRDGKVDEHDMLCVLRQECGLEIERIYHSLPLLRFARRSLRRGTCCLWCGLRRLYRSCSPLCSSPSVVVRVPSLLRLVICWL